MLMVLERCKRPRLCLFYLCIFSLYLANPYCDAFRLRRKEVSKSTTIDSKSGGYFSNEEDDDDNNEESAEVEEIEDLLDDDDDDDNEDEMRNILERGKKEHGVLFQKVHKVKYDLPSERKKILRQYVAKKYGDTNDDDDDDDDHEQGFIGKVFSFFRGINRLSSTSDDDDDDEDESRTVDEPKQTPVVKEKSVKPVTSTQTNEKVREPKKRKLKGWRGYLEKLPLGPLLDFISEGQSAEEDDDEPTVKIVVPKNIKPTSKLIEDVKKQVKEKIAEKSTRKKKSTIAPLPHHEFENLLVNIPSFVPNYTKIQNFECRYQGQIFERQLRGHKPWTLQMIDSSARITSGLLRGNINQLGDYDMCTDIATKVKVTNQDIVEIRGKYCLAHIDFYAIEDTLKGPLNLIQGKGFVKSTIDDPVHFIPRFTTTNWGMCLPSACNHEDAERILGNFLKPYNCTGLRVQIEVDPDNCYVEETLDIQELIEDNWEIPATLLFYSFCIACLLVATLSDYSKALKLDVLYKILIKAKSESDESKENDEKIVEKETKVEQKGVINNVLMAFSLKNTFPLLFNIDGTDEEQIVCVHGIKALGSILLFAAFRMIPLGRIPFNNRNDMTDAFNEPYSIVLRALFLYTDLFLLLSGLLCSYGVVKDIKSNGKVSVVKRIFGRIVRLVPTMLAVLLFYAYIWDFIGSGPQWGDLVTKNSELCRENMWQNLLFIQNWMPFEDICATHTFQLAIDMQLYIITPLLVWLFYKNPLIGLGAYGILHGFSTGARFAAVLDNRLSLVLFHGMKLSQIYRTANLTVSPTIHRATPYLIGIGLGIVLRDFEKNIKIPKLVVFISWLSSICGIAWCFWAPIHLVERTYQYDSSEAAQYAAMASLVFSVSLAWIIFACYFGYGSLLNKFLSSKIMILLSRLSYSIYLLEFIVFFTFAATQQTTENFTLLNYIDLQEVAVLVLAALLLTLVIDLPMQNIRRIILGNFECVGDTTEDVVKDEAKNNSHVNGTTASTDDVEPETVSPWDDHEEDTYVPQFRKGFEAKTETKRMSPREYFKSNIDEDLRGNPWTNNSTLNNSNYQEVASSEEEEEEEESEPEEEAEKELEPPTPTRPIRKWKWDIHED